MFKLFLVEFQTIYISVCQFSLFMFHRVQISEHDIMLLPLMPIQYMYISHGNFDATDRRFESSLVPKPKEAEEEKGPGLSNVPDEGSFGLKCRMTRGYDYKISD